MVTLSFKKIDDFSETLFQKGFSGHLSTLQALHQISLLILSLIPRSSDKYKEQKK